MIVAIDQRTGMAVLDTDACWDLLGSADVARIAAVVDGELEIFPVNTVVDDGAVLFRTGEGTKLAAVTIAPQVVVEADGYDAAVSEAWSVVLVGQAERLDNFDEIYRAENLPIRSWSGHPQQWFVRVRANRISGRRFSVVEPTAGTG